MAVEYGMAREYGGGGARRASGASMSRLDFQWRAHRLGSPQYTRRFRFVLDKARFDAGRGAFRAIEMADGTLQITDLELGNLVPGERAWIERTGFVVRRCRSPFGAG